MLKSYLHYIINEMSTEKRGDMPKSMKAARVVEFGKPIEIQEIDVPQPGPGEVLVHVRYCGVCHTDLDMRNGDLSIKPPKLPQTLGHEGVGDVYQTGPGVHKFKVGDRVLCGVVNDSCGCCPDCLEGCEASCLEAKLSGCNKDGQLAQFFLAKEDFLLHMPDHLKYEEAAPINCAGVTSYKALKGSKLWCGNWVVIVGAAGGLGYYAVQYAKAMGLKVIAVDKGEKKLDYLKQFEGIHCFDNEKEDVIKQIKELTDGKGAHGAVIIAPCKEAYEEAPKYLRHRGKLMIVGQPPKTELVEFDIGALVLKCLTVVGSLVGTRCDFMEALQLLADGAIKSEVTVRNLSEVNDIFDEMKKEEVFGRMVIELPKIEE